MIAFPSLRCPCAIAIGMLMMLGLWTMRVNAQTTHEPADSLQSFQNAITSAIAKAEDSVVAIAPVRKNSFRQPTDPSFVPNRFGSGVVIDSEGLILTNYHVIGDPSKFDYYVWVKRRPYRVIKIESVEQVKAADPWTDLAVLQIDADDLKPITFGSAEGLKRGDIAISLGNPYAIARDGQPSAGWGIISNLSRKATFAPSAEIESSQPPTLHHYGTLIQTDARLNLGTSGGALINLKGEMIGLTTSLAAMQQYESSAGFAIPVDVTFLRTVATLKEGKRAEFGFLGVGPQDLGADIRNRGISGVRVTQVIVGTPASTAGLQTGDIITGINGINIYDSNELMRDLGKLPVESEVSLSVLRGESQLRRGTLFDVSVKLSKKYVFSNRPPYSELDPPTWRGMRVDYSTAIQSFPLSSRQVDPEGCVAIVEVERDSPAWIAGLRPRDFVSHVGEIRVNSPQEFYDAVDDRAGQVDLTLTGGGGSGERNKRIPPAASQ